MQERRKRQHADLIADLQPDQRFAPRAISARSVYGFDSGRNGKGNCVALNSETFASRAFNISRYVLSVFQKARPWKNGVASGFAIDVARFPSPRTWTRGRRSEIRCQRNPIRTIPLGRRGPYGVAVGVAVAVGVTPGVGVTSAGDEPLPSLASFLKVTKRVAPTTGAIVTSAGPAITT